MKTKKIMQKMKLPMILVVFWLISQSGWAIAVVGYNLTSSNAATSGIAVNWPGQSRIMTISGITGSVSASNGYWCTGWNAAGTDAYVTSVFSAAGYIQLSGSFQMKASSTGPTALKVQWSTDGSSWTDAPMTLSGGGSVSATSLTTSYQTYNFTLPTSLNGAGSVYLRWVQVSTGTFAGNVGLTGVSIAGNAFAAPQTQATGISIIAVSSHSIKIGCSNGNGTHRIIKIRRDNNFDATPPAANDDVVGNTNYNGVGEQIIYNGTGSQVTVTTTPVTTEVFWFAVYEYNKMGSLTLYNTDLPGEVDKNQHKCQLETIINPTSINIGLVKATLGATITPSVNDIIERGIIWSTTSPVDDSGNYISEPIDGADGRASDGHGTYTISGDGWPTDGTGISVPRGSTIYYKGYAINASGQIMSEESSFSNVPIFTGTGTWETAARWNVQEVPGANGDATYGSVEDSPIINGICELGATNNVTNLTINAAKKLTINKDVKMQVDGTLTNNAGTSGILIKSIDVASDASANGSLIFANGSAEGTVEMFSKSEWNTSNPEGSRYKWQFFGIPVTTLNYNANFNYSGCFVRKWAENSTGYYDAWVVDNNSNILQLASGATLTPGLGYELVQQSNHKYSFAGTLVHSDFSQSLPYTSSAYFKGQSVLSNPYTAAMDISEMVFGANTEAAVYTYNTGTYNEWLNANAQYTPGTGPGTYTVTTKGAGGLTGVLTQIPSMQGFIVKSTDVAGGSVSFPYSSLIQNTEKQKAKASSKVGSTIDVIGTHYSDRMWILDDENCSPSFDNGYDGKKMLGSALASQLYGIQDNEPYQIQAVKNLNETYLGFLPGTDTSFKLVFNHQNLDTKYTKLYLFDIVANQTVDITAAGSEYSFTSTASDPAKRFKIIANTGMTTSIIESKNDNLIIFNQGNKLIIDCKLAEIGNLQLFDFAGKLQSQFKFAGNAISTLDTNLQKGIYIARLSVGSIETAQRIIIK